MHPLPSPRPSNNPSHNVSSLILKHSSSPHTQHCPSESRFGWSSAVSNAISGTYVLASTPTPNTESFSTPVQLLKYSPEKDQTIIGSKSGATISYGPFQNVGPTVGVPFQTTEQQILSVHYEYDKPILSVVNYERTAEVSHWGANLNIEDKVVLRNDGSQYVHHPLCPIYPV